MNRGQYMNRGSYTQYKDDSRYNQRGRYYRDHYRNRHDNINQRGFHYRDENYNPRGYQHRGRGSRGQNGNRGSEKYLWLGHENYEHAVLLAEDDSIDTFVTLSDRNVVRGTLLSSVSRVLVYLLVEVIVSVEEVELSAYMKSSHKWGLTERKIL